LDDGGGDCFSIFFTLHRNLQGPVVQKAYNDFDDVHHHHLIIITTTTVIIIDNIY
jgi:hypothetical protein